MDLATIVVIVINWVVPLILAFVLWYGILWVIGWAMSKLRRQSEYKPHKGLLYTLSAVLALFGMLSNALTRR